MALRAPLERLFQIVFQIADDDLGQDTPVVTGGFQRTMSRYRPGT